MGEESLPPFARYLSLAQDADVVGALEEQMGEVAGIWRKIPTGEADRIHPPYRWSIKQVMGHLIDTERVFGYRAMRISRGDQTPLPGFDQDAFVAAGGFERRAVTDLAAEFEAVRRAHVLMFANLPDGGWGRVGTASGIRWTVEDLGRAMNGHVRHHVEIVKGRLGYT